VSAPTLLYVAAERYHYWLGRPDSDPEGGLWLYAQCIGGPHDSAAIPMPISREHAAKMWLVLKACAEGA
jgi:hypothetical protein